MLVALVIHVLEKGPRLKFGCLTGNTGWFIGFGAFWYFGLASSDYVAWVILVIVVFIIIVIVRHTIISRDYFSIRDNC